MRAVVTKQFKLIHNLNYRMAFPIDQDFYISDTFQDMLNRTEHKIDLKWSKTLDTYYFRDLWELYDLSIDRNELNNVIDNPKYSEIVTNLQLLLNDWMKETTDPWICSPGGVLQASGKYKQHPTCMRLYNGET